jgi:hypothetical protein
VVVLEDVEKTKLVPIWIGVNEGNAIALEMQGEKFPRPLTHDLLVNMLKTLNAEIEKVVVSDLRDNSYYAIIYLNSNGRTIAIDARPSDSLALAVRVHCPIYIDDKVLKKCPQIGSVSGPITQEEIEKFKDTLKSMSPEDFFRNLEKAPPAPGPESESPSESEIDPEEGDPGSEEEDDDEEESK